MENNTQITGGENVSSLIDEVNEFIAEAQKTLNNANGGSAGSGSGSGSGSGGNNAQTPTTDQGNGQQAGFMNLKPGTAKTVGILAVSGLTVYALSEMFFQSEKPKKK